MGRSFCCCHGTEDSNAETGEKAEFLERTGLPMKAREIQRLTEHKGSTFDRFLEEEGIRKEVEAIAIKRVLAWQLGQAMSRHGTWK